MSDDDAEVAQQAQVVIDAAVGACIDQPGVHVTQISGLGTVITETELDEDQRMMLADFVEALRVKRQGKH